MYFVGKKPVTERIFSRAIPIYEWARVRVVFTSDISKSSARRGFTDEAVARTIFEGKGVFTIILRRRPDVNAVAHEAVHVAMQILHISGVRFNACTTAGHSTKNDEALAYLAGWIVGWIFTRRRKI